MIKKVFEIRALQLAPVWLLVVALAFGMWPGRFTGEDKVTVYLDMAAGKEVITPFAYRVLAPRMVGLLPLPTKQGFFVVTFFSTFGTLAFLYQLFRKIGISHVSSVITVILAGFSYPLAFYLGRWWRVDPFANLLFVIGFLLILERKLLLASVIIAFGVLAKETMMILVPILFVRALRSDKGEILGRLLHAGLLCISPVLVLIMLRVSIPPSSGLFDIHGPKDYLELWEMILAFNVGDLSLFTRIVRELLRSYGFLWPMALLGLFLGNGPGKEPILYSIYLLAAGFALCLVASDWSRMLGTTFPGIFILVSRFVEGVRKSHVPKWMLGTLITLAVVQSPLSLMEYRTLAQGGRVALAAGTVIVFLLGTAVSMRAFCLARTRQGVGNPKEKRA